MSKIITYTSELWGQLSSNQYTMVPVLISDNVENDPNIDEYTYFIQPYLRYSDYTKFPFSYEASTAADYISTEWTLIEGVGTSGYKILSDRSLYGTKNILFLDETPKTFHYEALVNGEVFATPEITIYPVKISSTYKYTIEYLDNGNITLTNVGTRLLFPGWMLDNAYGYDIFNFRDQEIELTITGTRINTVNIYFEGSFYKIPNRKDRQRIYMNIHFDGKVCFPTGLGYTYTRYDPTILYEHLMETKQTEIELTFHLNSLRNPMYKTTT